MLEVSSVRMPQFTSLEDACRKQATLGSRAAFVCNDETISFARFDQLSDQFAGELRARGVQEGERVVLVSKDSINAYALFFACIKLRAVFVPLNWRLSTVELAAIVSDCGSRLIVCGHDYLDRINADENLSILELENLVASSGHGFDITHNQLTNSPSIEQPVVQIYTSGTTGRPKGVVLSHRTFLQLLSGMRAIGDRWMDLSERDVILLSLPQFHIGGLWWAIQGFLAGATGVMLESFVGWKALELIQKHRITKVPMVPAMLQFVLAEPDIETADLSSVKSVLYGGSPISAELLDQAMQKFDCDFFQIYGLTETGNMAVCLRPEDHAFPGRRQAAGRALPGVQIKIIDSDGAQLPNFDVGEICLKSPSVMLEYFRKPAETRETLRNGWIHTGDAGYLDDDGYLFVCDRIKDMIIYAGEKIFPAEIESALREHESIADAAVIGIPDPRSGELIKAIMVCKAGAAAPKTKELVNFLKKRLADFKIPQSFDFVDSLPRNPSGKLLKHILRAPYWADQDRKVN